jgi:hypothetical protein
MTFLDRVLLEHLEVLEVLARKGRQVLQDNLDCLELQLLQGTLDPLGPLDLLALKVKMETKVAKVIVVKRGPPACLVQWDSQAEKGCKGKRGNRYLEALHSGKSHTDLLYLERPIFPIQT